MAHTEARQVAETKQEVELEFSRCRDVIDQAYSSVLDSKGWWLQERARREADTTAWEERERQRRVRQQDEWDHEDRRLMADEEQDRRRRLMEVRCQWAGVS